MSADPRVYHLATLTYDGRFWDVYLEFEEQRAPGDMARARLAFSPGDAAKDEEPVRTAHIFVEPTMEAAIARAQGMRQHHLLGLLRSCLP